MTARFDIRWEMAHDYEAETDRVYLVISERDQAGRLEGDIWIDVDQLPQFLTTLQTAIRAKAAWPH